MADLALGLCAWISFYYDRRCQRERDRDEHRFTSYLDKYPSRCDRAKYGALMAAVVRRYRIQRALLWTVRAALAAGVANQVWRRGWTRLAEMFAVATFGWALTEAAYQLHRLDDPDLPRSYPTF